MGNAQFVALEGPKGAGKTALCAALAAHLSPHVRGQVIITKEPTPAFDLQSEQNLRGADLARAIAADRETHVSAVIAPALAQGIPVVCDRYVLSSYVFHAGDGVSASIITELNQPFPKPSLNLILEVSPKTIAARRAKRGNATRLQSTDSAVEFSQYIHYAKLMESLGAAYKVCDNSNLEAQQAIVTWLIELLRAEIGNRDEHRPTGYRH